MKKQDQRLSELGIRLKIERKKQGLTQQTLAYKANTKQDYIAQIERDARNPSLRISMNILSNLDLSSDYLIYGIADESKSELDKVMGDFVNFLFSEKYKRYDNLL